MDKKLGIIVALLMSSFMAFVLSGIFTLINFGLSLEWLIAWTKGFFLAWPLAFVLVFVSGKPIRTLAERLVGNTQSNSDR